MLLPRTVTRRFRCLPSYGCLHLPQKSSNQREISEKSDRPLRHPNLHQILEMISVKSF